MVICQCGSAARSEPATDVMRLVRPAWSPLPSPSKSKFTPSSDLACSSGMSAPDRVAGAVGDDVSASSELCPKSFDGEHDPLPGRVGPGDQVGQILALEAVPARAALVQRAVGVHADGEVRQVDSPVMSNMGDWASVQ